MSFVHLTAIGDDTLQERKKLLLKRSLKAGLKFPNVVRNCTLYWSHGIQTRVFHHNHHVTFGWGKLPASLRKSSLLYEEAVWRRLHLAAGCNEWRSGEIHKKIIKAAIKEYYKEKLKQHHKTSAMKVLMGSTHGQWLLCHNIL